MSTFMVGYDLKKPDQDYRDPIDYLKSLGTWWHYLDSTWLVVSQMSAAELRDRLKTQTGPSDELLVINVTDDAWASTGFSTEANGWLLKYTTGSRAV